MKISHFRAVALCAAVMLSAPAVAEETGPYVGLSIGQAHHRLGRGDFDEAQFRAGTTSFDSTLDTDDLFTNGSVCLTVGWQLSSWLALEGSCATLGLTKYSYSATLPGSQMYSYGSDEYSAEAVTAATIVRLPIFERVFIAARVGAAYSRVKREFSATEYGHGPGAVTHRIESMERRSSIGPVFGLGVEFDTQRHVTFRLDWQLLREVGKPDVETDAAVDGFDIDFVSFSGIWRF